MKAGVKSKNVYGETKRRKLLAETALSGGVLALMLTANPQTAVAACTVNPALNTVTCTNTTTTSNTTNGPNEFLTTSTDRQQSFNARGAVTAAVTSNAIVDGFGLAITNVPAPTETIGEIVVQAPTTTNSDINFTNAGAVTLTTGVPSAGGSAALNLTSSDGNVTYSGNGNVDSGGFATAGVVITTTGAGDATFGTPTTPITGTELANGGTGILGRATGAGNVTITTTNQTIIAGVPLGIGISANTLFGNAVVVTDANIGTAAARIGTGISAVASGVDERPQSVSVTQTGGTIIAQTGIVASNAFGAVNVSQTAGTIMASGSAISIPSASSFGPPVVAANITTAGTVLGAGTSTNPTIKAMASSGPITIANSGIIGSITNLPTNLAIATGVAPPPTVPAATETGGGAATVSTSGTVTATIVVVGLPTTTVSNSGSITGTVALLGGPSVFENLGGTWTTSGLSTFSTGSAIENAGTLLATGTTTLSGGPTLNNLATGVINMQNGTASDKLTLSGNYVGMPGSRLAIDIDPAHQTADSLIIMGTARGSTTINAVYLSNGLLTSPIPIVQSASGSTATFTLANPLNGLFSYTLNQPTPGTFSLTSALSGVGLAAGVMNLTAAQTSQLLVSGVEAHLQSRRDEIQRAQCQDQQGEGCTPQAGRPLAYIGDDALSYQSDSARANTASDALATVVKSPPASQELGPKPALWAQAFDDWASFNESAAGQNFGRTINTYGFQMGFDETWRNLFSSADAFVLGIVGGDSQVNMKFDTMNMRVNLEGPGIGVYGMYVIGGFSADALVKEDWYSLSELDPSESMSTSVNLQNFSAAGNVQYKFWGTVKGTFIEPTAGFVYTNSEYGSQPTGLGLEDGHVLRLQSGARFGSAWDWNNIHFEPTLLALVYSDVTVTGTALQNIGVAAPTDEGLVRGEIDLELHADFGDGLSAFTRGETRFGEGLVEGAIKIGARKQW
jgi:outer membrane autotransporter protein